MANALDHRKLMTIGEGGSALAFAALAMFSIVVAAKAFTPEFAFHAYLFTAASIAAVFAIINRYYERPNEATPLIVDDKPNYNMGPVKFASIAAVFWGIAGFTVGCDHRAPARIPGSQFRSALDDLRPAAAAAHVGRDLRLRRQRADRDFDLRRAAHLPRAARSATSRPGSSFWGYNFFIVIAGTGYLLGITQSQGICRARMVRRPVADGRVGGLSAGLPRHDHAAQGAAHLRRQLVLSRLHRHDRGAAYRQQRSRCRCRCSRRSPTSSASGVQDAMVQWWYGHNAVGFFLTAGFLGMMYYFIPKQADRPVYSLSPVDHPLLVADLPLHLGRSASPALHRAARLGADARHGLLDHAVDAVLGRHDQRPHDAVGRLGQAAHRSGPAHAGRRPSPSTAWRPSKAR